MKQFINLSSSVLNKLHIIKIMKYPSKYYIHMNDNTISGYFLVTVGNLSSNQNLIEICENKNKQDYDIITDFIKEIK